MNGRPSPKPKQPRAGNGVAPDFATAIRLMYSNIRSGVANGAAITVLHIGEEQTAVASGSGVESAVITLALGSRRTATDHFKHEPPTAIEMENAIQAVEDEVARVRPMIVRDSKLFTADAVIRDIARLAGVADSTEHALSLDAMERTFDRLAAISLGTPASQEGIPSSAAFAATLLILREFMHHLRFSSIIVSEAD
jgi:exopolyphosphatase/pppGpp-phosphohydrolase